MLSMKLRSVSVAVLAICVAVLLFEKTSANPINFYGDESDRVLVQGMVDLFDAMTQEYDEPRNSIRAEERCHMPMRRGVCRALIPRWNYDDKIGDCREFKFGGCGGNANNFQTYKQCMQVCKGV